jgi:hypothetical protein
MTSINKTGSIFMKLKFAKPINPINKFIDKIHTKSSITNVNTFIV